jgi:hypothetical protein
LDTMSLAYRGWGVHLILILNPICLSDTLMFTQLNHDLRSIHIFFCVRHLDEKYLFYDFL